MTPRTIDELKKFLKDENTIIRIEGDDFKEMLLDNFSISIGEKSRFLQGIHIGSDVFMVRLLPKEWDSIYGTIQLDARTEWITKGTGLILKKPCCKS